MESYKTENRPSDYKPTLIDITINVIHKLDNICDYIMDNDAVLNDEECQKSFEIESLIKQSQNKIEYKLQYMVIERDKKKGE